MNITTNEQSGQPRPSTLHIPNAPNDRPCVLLSDGHLVQIHGVVVVHHGSSGVGIFVDVGGCGVLLAYDFVVIDVHHGDGVDVCELRMGMRDYIAGSETERAVAIRSLPSWLSDVLQWCLALGAVGVGIKFTCSLVFTFNFTVKLVTCRACKGILLPNIRVVLTLLSPSSSSNLAFGRGRANSD
jgi:hypothetical protein